MADCITFELMNWSGMDNSPDQVSETNPQTIWDCENVDFDEQGMIIKRRGMQSIMLTAGSTASDTSSNTSSFPVPWAYYKFDEESGTRVDATGNGHNLTVTENYPEYPAAHIDEGVIGNCLWSYEDNSSFDYSSWLEFTGGAETFPADHPFSFVFWWAGSNRGDEGNGGLEIYFPPAEAVLDINSLTTAPYTAYIYMDVFYGAFELEMELDGYAYDYTSWNMYSITFSGTVLKFYINNDLVWTSDPIDISGEGPLQWQDVLFTDGWYNGEGYLDEAGIYAGYELTTDQIAWLVTNKRPEGL